MTEPLRQQLAEYLNQTFGENFWGLLSEPEGVQTGERVLYKVRSNTKVTRQEPSERDQQAFRQDLIDLATRTGGTQVTFEPPVSSGLPYPRLIDLPGSSIMWDSGLRTYMNSEMVLPSEDFPLEWVVGVVHTPSQSMLLYLDFTHATVKAIFRVFYDAEYASGEHARAGVLTRFKQFQTKKQELEADCERRRNVAWAKLVQIDTEPLWTRIKPTAPTP